MTRSLLPLWSVLACCAAGGAAAASGSFLGYLGAVLLMIACTVALCRADMLRRRSR